MIHAQALLDALPVTNAPDELHDAHDSHHGGGPSLSYRGSHSDRAIALDRTPIIYPPRVSVYTSCQAAAEALEAKE